MRLPSEFIRLPLHFDTVRLAHEVNQFAEADWRPHPQGHPGNTAIPLIAAQGDPTNDSVKGPMRPTPHLQRCPYLRQVLAAFGTALGRTRLMRIAGQAEATPHVDHNYYWLQRVRIHVPAITSPEVRFLCGDSSVHMAAGECWLFDTWRLHNVLNNNDAARIHLVSDTVGSASFWDMVDRSVSSPSVTPPAVRFVPFEPGKEVRLDTESVNLPVVMCPWEIQHLIGSILGDLRKVEVVSNAEVSNLEASLRSFHRHWQFLWACHGTASSGWDAYRQALEQFKTNLAPFAERFRLPNNMEVVEILQQAIIRPALNPDLDTATRPTPDVVVAPAIPATLARNQGAVATRPRFDRPIFIMGAPRSGTSALFEALARSPQVWTIGGESHGVIERIPQLAPANRGFDSNRLTAADATPVVADALRANFLAKLRDPQGRPLPAQPSFRLLEKTPKNSLRIPFLKQVFPDALFIYLFREPAETLSSILEAWRSGKFVTYPQLPEWQGPPWSLLLIPGWRNLRGKDLASIAAAQWLAAQQHILDDLAKIPADHWTATTYAEMTTNPQGQMRTLCQFAGIGWDAALEGSMPLSRHTLTPPSPDKWRANADVLLPVLPQTEAMAARARQLFAQNESMM